MNNPRPWTTERRGRCWITLGLGIERRGWLGVDGGWEAGGSGRDAGTRRYCSAERRGERGGKAERQRGRGREARGLERTGSGGGGGTEQHEPEG